MRIIYVKRHAYWFSVICTLKIPKFSQGQADKNATMFPFKYQATKYVYTTTDILPQNLLIETIYNFCFSTRFLLSVNPYDKPVE